MPYKNRVYRFVRDESIVKYPNVSVRTKTAKLNSFHVMSFESDRDPIRNSIWESFQIFLLSYPNEQRDRDRLHHMLYIYCGLTVSKLNESHKDVPTPITSDKVLQLSPICQARCS